MMDEKKNIGSLFDRIAGKYDRINHLLSLDIDKWWRRRAVRQLSKADRVLDVAVGTGDLAIELVRSGKAQQVQGIDLSAGMLAVAAKKVAAAGLSDRIKMEQGSAFDMPYADDSFDVVTCGFGVRNFSDLDKGLREMYRVLRPGGEVLVLEFGYPEQPVMRWLYDFYFSRLMPLIGRLVSGDRTAYAYFRNSVKGFVRGEAFCDRLRQAGFRDVTFTAMTFGICMVYKAAK